MSAHRPGIFAALLVAVVFGVLDCDPRPATQLVVRIDTDLDSEITAVEVTVRYVTVPPTRPFYQRTFRVGPGAFRIPGTIAITPSDPHTARRVEVYVTAPTGVTQSEPCQQPRQRAIVTLRPERVTVVDMFLPRRCTAGTACMCGEGYTCGIKSCEPVARGPLDDYDPDASPFGDVCRANVLVDPRNCGTCGHECRNPLGRPTCIDGRCAPTCERGTTNEDGDDDNGCETVRLNGMLHGVSPPYPDGVIVKIGVVDVRPFDPMVEGSGTLVVDAETIIVEGRIDARGKGYGGGGGAGGGAGHRGRCASSPACSIAGLLPRAPGGSGVAGGSPGQDGLVPEADICEGCCSVAGTCCPNRNCTLGRNGGRGAGPGGGNGGEGVRVTTNPSDGANGANGSNGTYDAPPGGAMEGSMEVHRGSGGGGGGGGSGASAESGCNYASGGGGGGAGARGGGAVTLVARSVLRVEGAITTTGSDSAGRGADGVENSRCDSADIGGNGGDARINGTRAGGSGGTRRGSFPCNCTGFTGGTGMPYTGGNGGTGGTGAGGGVLLRAPVVELRGTTPINALGGGESPANGGTVKIFHDNPTAPLWRTQIRAGRLPLDCPYAGCRPDASR